MLLSSSFSFLSRNIFSVRALYSLFVDLTSFRLFTTFTSIMLSTWLTMLSTLDFVGLIYWLFSSILLSWFDSSIAKSFLTSSKSKDISLQRGVKSKVLECMSPASLLSKTLELNKVVINFCLNTVISFKTKCFLLTPQNHDWNSITVEFLGITYPDIFNWSRHSQKLITILLITLDVIQKLVFNNLCLVLSSSCTHLYNGIATPKTFSSKYYQMLFFRRCWTCPTFFV